MPAVGNIFSTEMSTPETRIPDAFSGSGRTI